MKLSPVRLSFILMLMISVPLLLRGTVSWPNLMNYQGRLTDSSGNAVPDGAYPINFYIYSVASGGSFLWNEAQTVNVNKGLFNVVLGSVNSLSVLGSAVYSSDLWIAIKVASDAEMTPRQQLLPSAYAMNAQTLDGLNPDNTANNLVVLDGAGKVPSGLIPSVSLTLPYDASAAQSTYNLNVSNTSASSSALGLKVSAPNGISSQATDSSGYAIWGLTAPSDNVSAVGVRGSATNGVGILATSVSNNALSATTQSNSKAAIYASGAIPGRFIVNTAIANNFAVNASTVAGDLVANLVDRGSKSGLFVSTTAASTFGVSATAAAGTGLFGQTTSGSATDYGVFGSNTGNIAAGVGVEGTGFMGVQGQTTQTGGRGVEGDVGSTVSGAFGVRGSNAFASGTAVFGSHGGTGAGYGVRGGSVNGVGAVGVYGAVSGTGGAVGIMGYASDSSGYGAIGRMSSLAIGTGVRGEGNQGVYGLSNGDCGVCAFNVNGGSGSGLSSSSPVLAIWAQSSATVVQGTGISATVQSSVAGSAAGAFNAQAASGATYGVSSLNNSSASGSVSIYGVGGQHAFHAKTGNGGINYYSDESNAPAYGFYHSDNAAPVNGIGIYVAENCITCYSGFFSNVAGTNDGSAALRVDGRVVMPYNAGTVTAAQGATTATINNNYITPTSLIFLTVATQTTVVAAVTNKTNNSATITFSGPLPAITTYQYLVIGQ